MAGNLIRSAQLENNPAGFLARSVTDQAGIANTTWVPVTFDTTVWNPDGGYDEETYQYTVVTSGIYLVTLQLQISPMLDGKWGYCGIYKNGTLYRYTNKQTASNSAVCVPNLAFLVDLVADDYLEARVYHGNGDADPGLLNNNTTVTFFGAKRIP